MKLSEAILKGAEQHPQVFGRFFMWDADERYLRGTCALGAALIAVYGDLKTPADGAVIVGKVPNLKLYQDLGLSSNEVAADRPCPHCTKMCGSLTHIIEHLNDDHRATREVIAAWLDRQGL